jgi:hypothetical protein
VLVVLVLFPKTWPSSLCLVETASSLGYRGAMTLAYLGPFWPYSDGVTEVTRGLLYVPESVIEGAGAAGATAVGAYQSFKKGTFLEYAAEVEIIPVDKLKAWGMFGKDAVQGGVKQGETEAAPEFYYAEEYDDLSDL